MVLEIPRFRRIFHLNCHETPTCAAMVRFGQVVVGPPGSGKTTYCLGMCQYMKAIGRDAAVINLDPANHGEGLPYTAAVDIQELVSVEVRVHSRWFGSNDNVANDAQQVGL